MTHQRLLAREEMEGESAELEPSSVSAEPPQPHGASHSNDESAGGSSEAEPSYKLSPWRARSVAASWLERQGLHGRSKTLVPELLELEERLQAWTREGVNDWLRGLWQLVQHLRWGVGTFWAPHYNTSPEVARGIFTANILVTSPLHLSDAAAR
eukprot:COSAG06_NODE_30604_length_535_cov_23.107798_1_plen_153_part_01